MKIFSLKKRLILASVLFLLTIYGSFKSLAYDFEADGLYYKILNDSSVAVTYFSWYHANQDAYQGEIKIPATVPHDGNIYSVCEIDLCAFNHCERISSLTIPNTINKIENQAFKDCFGIIKLIIEDGSSTLNIGNGFRDCTLQEIYLGRNVEGGFKDQSNLTKLTFGPTVTRVDFNCFSGCTSLTEIAIPGTIIEIGAYAFHECSSLKNLIIPNSITTISEGVFSKCSGLTNIVIPNSVTTIGEIAFEACSSLGEVTIPASVIEMRGNSFNNCSNLKKIIIMDSTIALRIDGWSGCGHSFCQTNIKSVFMGRNLDCSEPAFMNQKELTELIIGDSVTRIGKYDFYGCTSLNNFNIPNSVIEIAPHAFDGCTALTSLTIPYTVSKIGPSAFSSCSGLTNVFIANPDTEIENGAFFSCDKLKVIKLGTTTLEKGRGKSSCFF